MEIDEEAAVAFFNYVEKKFSIINLLLASILIAVILGALI